MKISDQKFQIGFWHPFGPHAGENAEEIIERKRKEIKRNGWTLWSFQFRKSLPDWYQEIERIKSNSVLVFCSEGKGTRDPAGGKKHCTYFKLVGDNTKNPIPSGIEVPHSMGSRSMGSAFIVEKIIYPASFAATPIEWLKNGEWQTARLPTRPEYLIRPGNGSPMRGVRAILELKAPYLAEVGIDPDTSANPQKIR